MCLRRAMPRSAACSGACVAHELAIEVCATYEGGGSLRSPARRTSRTSDVAQPIDARSPRRPGRREPRAAANVGGTASSRCGPASSRSCGCSRALARLPDGPICALIDSDHPPGGFARTLSNLLDDLRRQRDVREPQSRDVEWDAGALRVDGSPPAPSPLPARSTTSSRAPCHPGLERRWLPDLRRTRCGAACAAPGHGRPSDGARYGEDRRPAPLPRAVGAPARIARSPRSPGCSMRELEDVGGQLEASPSGARRRALAARVRAPHTRLDRALAELAIDRAAEGRQARPARARRGPQAALRAGGRSLGCSRGRDGHRAAATARRAHRPGRRALLQRRRA